MRQWLSLRTDRGGVLWGILCCWLAVAANIILFDLRVPVFYVVPLDLFGVPLTVTLVIWLIRSDREVVA